MSRWLFGLVLSFAMSSHLSVASASTSAGKPTFLSPPLPLIGNQRLELAIPKGWKVRSQPDQSWNYSSYDFDLVPVAPQHGEKTIGVEILMHALSRAKRHGDLYGETLKTASGLRGIAHYEHGSWYFAVPYSRLETAIILCVSFSGGKIDEQRAFVRSLFRSVRFLAPPKAHTPVHPTSTEKPNSLRIPGFPYRFEWRRDGNQQKYEWGDVLSVFDADAKANSKPLFRKLFNGMFVSRILPWTAPQGGEDVPDGFMVTFEYGAGSTLHYAIFANLKGHIKQVLDLDTGYAWYSHPLEVVDLDGDTYPELISVDDYRLILKSSDVGEETARVWKWSSKRNEYVLARVSTYAERLKPLKPSR